MRKSKYRVGVGIEPFVLRSALHTVLSRDPRLESVLLPAGEEAEHWATHTDADALILSRPVHIPERLVVVLSDSPPEVELLRNGSKRRQSYRGPAWLADLLVDEAPVRPERPY